MAIIHLLTRKAFLGKRSVPYDAYLVGKKSKGLLPTVHTAFTLVVSLVSAVPGHPTTTTLNWDPQLSRNSAA